MNTFHIENKDKEILKQASVIINKISKEIVDNGYRTINCNSPIICAYSALTLKQIAVTIASIIECDEMEL